MSPYKVVINKTDKPITIRLAPRKGEKPSGGGRLDSPAGAELPPRTDEVTISPGSQQKLSYGDDQNPYIDALIVDYSDAVNDWRNYRQRALIAEATQWGADDRALNSNDTATVAIDSNGLTITMSNGPS